MEWQKELSAMTPENQEKFRFAECAVALIEENVDAAKIYMLTRGQIVSVGEQAIDINHVALWQAIDRYRVKDPLRCFEMVNKLFHYFLNEGKGNEGS